MRPNHLVTLLLSLLCISVAVSLSAQVDQSATGQSTSVPPEEHKVGDYMATGSVDVGYRWVAVSGSEYPCSTTSSGLCDYTGMWNTFEDLRPGPRVLDQTLSLRSIGNTGVLFDDLFTSSFGWGGDPVNVASLRMSKHRAYNLNVLFRRDYQVWDYNILANPLNPSTSVPNIPILSSPHSYDTVRRMWDVGLTLAPQSKISVRLGYNYNRFEGPSFATFHMPMGTDIAPGRGFNWTNNGFRAGVDLKFIPRTTISFDGDVNWFKQDTADSNPLLPFIPFTVGGTPANFGVSWNTAASQPCGSAVVGTATCNLDFTFSRQDRYRTTMPTVAGTLESHYWKRLDLTARGLYGWADLSSVFNQIWNGFVPRPRTRQEQITNTPSNNRISNGADFGITYHVTDHFRISDSFHYVNQKMPRFAVSLDTAFVVPPGSTALTPLGAPTVTAHGVSNGLFESLRSNETDFQFDVRRWVGFTIGYRYDHRFITVTGESFDVDAGTGERTSPFEPGEVGFDHFSIPQDTAIGGLWLYPNDKFRLNVDVQASSAGIKYVTPSATLPFPALDTFVGDTTFTRITPRHQQQYRVRATYLPNRFVTVTGNVNILEQRNTLTDLLYFFHNRSYGITADIAPNDRLLLDIAYNYQNYLQNDLICFVGPTTAAGTFPGPAFSTAGLCPLDPTYLGNAGNYSNGVNFGVVQFRVKPAKRVTVDTGYSIVTTNGSFTNTNSLIPPGPTSFNYHRPLAALEVEMSKGLALKGGWNYYDYNEKGSSANLFGSGGPTLPRDFHSNTGTISLRYSF